MSDLITKHEGLAKARTLLEIACVSARIDSTLIASDEAACESTYCISFERREGTHSALVVVRGRDVSLWTGKNGEDLFAFLDAQCPRDLGPMIRAWLTGGEA